MKTRGLIYSLAASFRPVRPSTLLCALRWDGSDVSLAQALAEVFGTESHAAVVRTPQFDPQHGPTCGARFHVPSNSVKIRDLSNAWSDASIDHRHPPATKEPELRPCRYHTFSAYLATGCQTVLTTCVPLWTSGSCHQGGYDLPKSIAKADTMTKLNPSVPDSSFDPSSAE